MPKETSPATTRRSAARASWNPAPRAWPCTEAITGFGVVARRWNGRWASLTSRSNASDPPGASSTSTLEVERVALLGPAQRERRDTLLGPVPQPIEPLVHRLGRYRTGPLSCGRDGGRPA